jgi:hypothetical protein
MGVPKFFSQVLSKRQGGKFIYRYDGIVVNELPEDPTSLLIDFNAMIYNAANEFFMLVDQDYPELNEKQLERRRNELLSRKQREPVQVEKEFLLKIINNLSDLIRKVDPTYFLFIAIDGSVPQSKMYQQRKRRLNLPKDSIKTELFPGSSMISPGTEFMFKLDAALQEWIKSFTSDSPVIVRYSGHMVPGEGEHKIMEFLRGGGLNNYNESYEKKYSKPSKHIFHGMDIDLIILCLMSPVKNVYLWRQDASLILDIDNLKLGVKKEMNNETTGIDDFVLLTTFLGNDFLPCQPSLEDYSTAFNSLIQIYLEFNKSLTDGKGIHLANLINFIKTVNVRKVNTGLTPFGVQSSQIIEVKQEELNLRHEADRQFYDVENRMKTYKSYPLLYASSVSLKYEKQTNERGSIVTKMETSFDMNKFVSAWYDLALNPMGVDRGWVDENLGKEFGKLSFETIEKMVIEYIIGIHWMFSYYKLGQGSVNWEWYYPYHFTPLFQQIAAVDWVNVMKNNKIRLDMFLATYTPDTAANVLIQMLSILPTKYLSFLPSEMWNIPKLYLDDLYPQPTTKLVGENVYYTPGFPIILDGKLNEHEGIAIVPFVDRRRMEEVFKRHVFLPPVLKEKYTPQGAIEVRINPDRLMEQVELRYQKSVKRNRNKSRFEYTSGFPSESYIPGPRGPGSGRGSRKNISSSFTGKNAPFGSVSAQPVPFGSVPAQPVLFGATPKKVPFGSVPTQPVPFGSVPTQPVPFGSVPTQPVPFGSVPTQPVPFGSVPTQPVPFGATPKKVPFGNAPVQPVPFGNAPVQPVPFGNAPVQPVPFGNAPVQPVPFGNAPVQPVPFGATPKKVPFGNSPVQPVPFGAIPKKVPFGNVPTQPNPFGASTKQPMFPGQTSPFGTTSEQFTSSTTSSTKSPFDAGDRLKKKRAIVGPSEELFKYVETHEEGKMPIFKSM